MILKMIRRLEKFYDDWFLWLWYVVFIVLLFLILGAYTRVRQRWEAITRVDQAMEEYAAGRVWVLVEQRNLRGPGGGYYEVTVDWKDDNSPHPCTLIIRWVDGKWKVTDEECQGG